MPPKDFWKHVTAFDIGSARDLRDSTLFDDIPCPATICDFNGLYIAVNPSFASALGYERHELEGVLTFWELTPKEIQQESVIAIESAKNFGRFGWVEKQWQHKNSGYVRGRVKGSLIVKNGKEFMFSIIDLY